MQTLADPSSTTQGFRSVNGNRILAPDAFCLPELVPVWTKRKRNLKANSSLHGIATGILQGHCNVINCIHFLNNNNIK